ncbi:alpha/beta-hydrolase [Annulohypoxylon truncatum]|uniref:alpha/beta-hydrolase n=1 Tax=Annulohypoxylon truncatum TaxID=327061 RepID=UPI002007F87C|nr:alpha/beta-hydrolase [Annulohypoxylon truncatum]KAI1204278.1 alpha/beta-hydrolase [Annulohypoxylon truncatum]
MLLRALFMPLALFPHLCLTQDFLAPVVDLDYALYQGYYNTTYDLNIYKGIRYAAPPIGKLRWQLPQPPAQNRSQVIPAIEYASRCPQSGCAPRQMTPVPSGSEDCLFLNVLAPANKTMLPVLVWIHGGGYGVSSGAFEPSPQMHTNENTYIIVTIQYRLGAFGFLSSAELAESGVPNAGIHDMQFALQWVQKYIHLFGGDPTQVTIAGQSAGGGSVALLGMADGGVDNTTLEYNSTMPTNYYYRFAEAAGCLPDDSKPDGSVFQCLTEADTIELQEASDYISTTGLYGQWAFIPVTDGKLLRGRPSSQLLNDGELNGIRILSSNNPNEAPGFIPQGIDNEDRFRGFLFGNYPLLSEENITSILTVYFVPENSSSILVNSDGEHPPYSMTNSGWASGWQQAATNLYAETTFICPSYWLADGYARKQDGKAWHYQFSVPPGQHGLDQTALRSDIDVMGTGMDEVFRTAIQQIWGNFIVRGDPALSKSQTRALHHGNITAVSDGKWPEWKGEPGHDWMVNLNMTGGVPTSTTFNLDGTSVQVISYVPGNSTSSQPLEAIFKVVEGSSWEGGRGERCRLWADLGPWIMA